MNTKKSVAWLLAGAASLTVAAPVFAQDYHDDDRGPPHDQRDHRDHDDRGDYRDDRPGPDHGPHGDWHRGDRYDGPRYVVEDYRRYDLPPPPDDRHRWVRDRNGDFVLIAITTGIITDLLLGGHHR